VLQWDKSVTHGQLENGLTYFLYDSDNANEPFNIRLIVNAGSVDETGYSGVAHMVEHMVFRKTSAHSESLHSYFSSLGWSTGKQINAMTRETETQYMLRTRVNDSLDLLGSVALMGDIAFGAIFDEEDWKQEQKVILEEWRRGESTVNRVERLKKEQLRHDSRYVNRPTIGTQDSILSTPVSEIKAFYHRFYVPSNMTLIISGNIDKQDALKAIEQYFGQEKTSPIPNRDYVELPLAEQFHIGSVQDPQGTTSAVVYGFRSVLAPAATNEREFDDLVRYFLRKLMRNQVIRDRSLIDDQAISIRLEEPLNHRVVAAMIMRTGNHDAGLKLLLTEVERLKQFGIDATEFNELKDDARKVLQRQKMKGEINRDYQAWEDKITNAVMAGKVLPNSQEKAAHQLSLLEQITLETVNHRLKQLLSAPDQFLYYQLPGNAKVSLPLASTVQQIQNEARQLLTPTVPYLVNDVKPIDTTEVITLPPITLYPEGDIQRFKRTPPIGDAPAISQWWLTNGDRIIWLERPTSDGKVYVNAVTDVGFDNQTQSPQLSQIAVQLWQQTPPRGWSEEQWKLMPQWNWVYKSQQLSQAAVIAPAQLAQLFDAYSLQLHEGQISADGLNTVKADLRNRIARQNKNVIDVNSLMIEEKYLTKLQTLDESMLAEVNVEMLETIAKEVLSQPVTFYVVGVLPSDVEELWQQKVSTITRNKTLISAPLLQKTGHHKRESTLQGTPKTQVKLEGYSQLEWSPERAFLTSSLSELTHIALKQRLRQQLAGVYSVSFDLTFNPQSDRAEIVLSFSCAPERREELLNAAKNVLETMPQWLKQQDLAPLIANIRYAEKQRLSIDSTWLKRLELSDHRYGDGRYLENIYSLPSLVTNQGLATLAAQIFPIQHSVTVITEHKKETANN